MKTQSLLFKSASLWFVTTVAKKEETRERRMLVTVMEGSKRREVQKQKHSLNIHVGWRMSESGNSSKFEVSSMLLISIGMAAGLSLSKIITCV